MLYHIATPIWILQLIKTLKGSTLASYCPIKVWVLETLHINQDAAECLLGLVAARLFAGVGLGSLVRYKFSAMLWHKWKGKRRHCRETEYNESIWPVRAKERKYKRHRAAAVRLV